ncbi:MAG: molybdopterin oxidoreductase family protein [Tepidisphaeraceae bacterium]
MRSTPVTSLQQLTRAALPATRTHCPFCAFQCGMTLAVNDGVPAITGDEAFPVNRGQMCIKGFSSGELLTRGDRVAKPLIRDGSGRLGEATWDAALDLIATTIARLRSQHGADSIAAFGSGSLTNEKAYWLGKFVRLAIGSRHIDYNGRYCMSSAAAAQNRAFGLDRGMPFPVADIAQTRSLLLWGSNIADTMPPLMQWLAEQRENGGTQIVVDPRRTETAAAADVHLQLTPGTDLALANGLLWIAIDERLIDLDYIATRTTGFDAVRASIIRYFPAYVERLTGVSEPLMRRTVRLLADGPSMLLSGRGAEQQSKGVDSALACINLMLALGQCGKPNAGFGTLTGQGNGQGGREHGQKCDQLPGYRSIEDPADRAAVAKAWGVDVDRIPHKGLSAVELLTQIGAGVDPIRALLVFGSNIAVATPDAGALAKRLASIDLLVVADSFLNETCEHAHVVLPVTQWAEEEGTLTNLEGRVIRRRRAATPPAGARSDIDILTDLAERLGAGELFRHRSARGVFDEFRRVTAGAKADYSGISYERIDREQGVCWPCPSSDHPGSPRLFLDRFAHPDGRARFHVVEHRDAGELPDSEFPFYFTTGRYREQYNSGAQTRRVRKLREQRPRPKLQLHPDAADRLGLLPGEVVRVVSRRGEVVFDVDITASIRPDTVFAPFHYGGRDAANRLTNPALDPISRMPEFKLCAVRVERVETTEQHDA